jgi:hypothetical protein
MSGLHETTEEQTNKFFHLKKFHLWILPHVVI